MEGTIDIHVLSTRVGMPVEFVGDPWGNSSAV